MRIINLLLLPLSDALSFRTLNHIFKGYFPHKGGVDTGRNGALISMAQGESSGYAMAPLQARGTMFIHTQTDGTHALLLLNGRYLMFMLVYPGMVIGECSKSGDLYVNPTAKKQLTNIRAAGADEKIVISSPKIMTLEENIAYMADDELVEITPKSIRLRKLILNESARRNALKRKN